MACHKISHETCSFLLESGVDAVKTDAQFYLDEMHAAPDRRHFMKSVQDAWVVAALRHFGVQAIKQHACQIFLS